jgi:hypothetical protein
LRLDASFRARFSARNLDIDLFTCQYHVGWRVGKVVIGRNSLTTAFEHRRYSQNEHNRVSGPPADAPSLLEVRFCDFLRSIPLHPDSKREE